MRKKPGDSFRLVRRAAMALGFLAGAILFAPDAAFPHRVIPFAWVEGNTVRMESKFAGGRKVSEGRVIVEDLEGNRLLEGHTDSEGKFSFEIPRPVPLRIIVEAGPGHRGEWIVSAEEVRGSTTQKNAPADADAGREPRDDRMQAGEAIEEEKIRRAVEDAVERKLEPIREMLAKQRTAGPSLRDILGGTGYILGLMGLAAFVHYRRKRAEIERRSPGGTDS